VTVGQGTNDLKPAAAVNDQAALEQRPKPLDDMGRPSIVSR